MGGESRSLRGAQGCALFFDSTGEQKSREAKSRGKRPRTSMVDAIIDGERVYLAKPHEREKGVETRIRVALAAAGVLVWKHHVDNRAGARTGLGIGTADLICVVPPFGRLLGIEVKTKRGRVRESQERWLGAVRRFGGVTGVARSVEEAMALVAEARALPAAVK